MIKEIYLMTNRNLLVFDEKGEQVHDLQNAIHWGTSELKHSERDNIERFILKQTEPIEFYLSQWSSGSKMKLNLEEFLCLLGHGEWYYKIYKGIYQEAV